MQPLRTARPDQWIDQIFAASAAVTGGVIRRNVDWVQREIGEDRFFLEAAAAFTSCAQEISTSSSAPRTRCSSSSDREGFSREKPSLRTFCESSTSLQEPDFSQKNRPQNSSPEEFCRSRYSPQVRRSTPIQFPHASLPISASS